MRRLIGCLSGLLLSATVLAEGILVPLGEQGQQGTPVAEHGQSRLQVLERFGLAGEEHPAVGNPPITRWDYRDFSVYFEHDRVIQSVRHHRPSSITQREQAQ